MKNRIFGVCFVLLVVTDALFAMYFLGQNFAPHAVALNDLDPNYSGWETPYEYIDIDTTWHKDDNLVFNKPVFVDGGATLTIEAGATVYLNGGDITVNDGNIVAIGTQDEPVTMTSNVEKPFTIVFRDQSTVEDGGKESHLLYAHIKRGGFQDNPSMCGDGGVMIMNTLLPSFINTAYASNNCFGNMPAMQYKSGRVLIEHTNFLESRFADILMDGYFNDAMRGNFFKVIASNFESDASVTAVIAYSTCRDMQGWYVSCQHDEMDMRGNWWGDASGPYYTIDSPDFENSNGRGRAIFGHGEIFVKPFAGEKFANGMDCLEQCFSNVMFLPGVEASRLYAYDDPDCAVVNCENQLWEPNRNADVQKLYLDSHGKSTDAYDIYTRDVIDEANFTGQNIYKSFIEKMDALKDTEHLINDWAPEPYDWRLSLADILQGGTETADGISYIETTDTPHILTELQRLASTSKTGKVTIVAHSNGGLVAKALMQKIGDVQTKKLIDTVILVASPQIGTPVTTGVMLHGYGQDLLGGLILSKATARGLAQNMPSAYGLLPSREYFETVQAPAITIDTEALPEWSAKYGEIIHTYDALKNFLTDTYQRVDATSENTVYPSQLRAGLMDNASVQHETLDAWTAPAGVRVVQIAGWGVPATVSGMHYTKETKMLLDMGTHTFSSHEEFVSEPVFTEDGDGTVVTPSALYMGDAERYWVDIKKWDTNHQLTTLGGKFGPEHAGIFEVPEINTFILNLLKHTAVPITDYTYMSAQAPESNKHRLEYSLHSPLALNLYDDEGRHTGLDQDGNIEEQIPGTYYRQFGEVKYIFSDASAKYHLTLNGYAAGTFTLEVEELQGDVSQGKVSFKDIPTTDKTKATLEIPDGVASIDAFMIDEDGDGKVDTTMHAKQNTIVMPIADDVPTTTLYDTSHQTDISPTVNSSEQAESVMTVTKKKTQHKKEKKHAKSAREIRRSKKAALIRKKSQNAKMLPVKQTYVLPVKPVQANAVQNASKETKNEMQASQNSVSQDTVVKLPYQEPSVWKKITKSIKNMWQSFKLPW